MNQQCEICDNYYTIKAYNATELSLLPRACQTKCFIELLTKTIKLSLPWNSHRDKRPVNDNQFRSELEEEVYMGLRKHGFEVEHEPIVYTIDTRFYYVPDFIVSLPEYQGAVAIEAKGKWQNGAIRKVLSFKEYLQQFDSNLFVITRPVLRGIVKHG